MGLTKNSNTGVMWVIGASIWLFACARLLDTGFFDLALRLGDTDDAMRLVEFRRFLAGASWFDMSLPRVSPPEGLLSHWSRLIDAGLAGLFHFFSLFVSAKTAEIYTRAVWPMLWIAPAMAGAVLIAVRLGGKLAGLVVLTFLLFTTPGAQMFAPGRIDHHNVQIALAVLAVAATLWVGKHWFAPVAAGFLVALMLAVGLENVPFSIAAGVIICMQYVLKPSGGKDLSKFGLSLAVFTLLAFMVSVPQAQWFTTYCDAIAINSALPLLVAGTGLALVGKLVGGDASRGFKISMIAVVGAGATAVLLLLDPACAGGPFAHIDPAIKPIWLDHVAETYSVVEAVKEFGLGVLAVAAFPIVALVMGVYLVATTEQNKNVAFISLLLVLVISFALMLTAVRAFAYAMWLAFPIVAVFVTYIWERDYANKKPSRLTAAIARSPIAVAAILMVAYQGIGFTVSGPAAKAKINACLETSIFAKLAKQPTGIVVAAIDLGPAIIANTPHSVLAAPYHRLSGGIVDTFAIFTSPSDKAREIVGARQVDYIVFCKSNRPDGPASKFGAEALWNRLKDGRAPKWLDLVRASKDDVLQIYHVKR